MVTNKNKKSEVVGIIVSYQPKVKELQDQINELIKQLDKVLLIENGSEEAIQFQIKNSFYDKKIEIIILKENQGLAKAQNIGIKRGLELGVDYFLFLDDDSSLQEGGVENLVEEFENNSKVGIAACHILHRNSNKIQKYWIRANFFYKRMRFMNGMRKMENVNTVISSGSMISKRVILECGLMRDDYFIDYIDIEYCLRVRAKGYTISVIYSAQLLHELGNTKSNQIGNIFFYPTNHNPNRRFFMIRNRIWTWKLYAFQFPGWFFIDFGNFLVDNLRVFIFEKDRIQNIKYFALGMKEGIIQKIKLYPWN